MMRDKKPQSMVRSSLLSGCLFLCGGASACHGVYEGPADSGLPQDMTRLDSSTRDAADLDMDASCPPLSVCWDFVGLGADPKNELVNVRHWKLDSCWDVQGTSLITTKFPTTSMSMDSVCNAFVPAYAVAQVPANRGIRVKITQSTTIGGAGNYANIFADFGTGNPQLLQRTQAGSTTSELFFPTRPTTDFSVELQLYVGRGSSTFDNDWTISRIEIGPTTP